MVDAFIRNGKLLGSSQLSFIISHFQIQLQAIYGLGFMAVEHGQRSSERLTSNRYCLFERERNGRANTFGRLVIGICFIWRVYFISIIYPQHTLIDQSLIRGFQCSCTRLFTYKCGTTNVSQLFFYSDHRFNHRLVSIVPIAHCMNGTLFINRYVNGITDKSDPYRSSRCLKRCINIYTVKQ